MEEPQGLTLLSTQNSLSIWTSLALPFVALEVLCLKFDLCSHFRLRLRKFINGFYLKILSLFSFFLNFKNINKVLKAQR